MNTGLTSTRYANALYQFALQKNKEDRVYEQMKLLVKSFSVFDQLRSVLDNPVLDNSRKKSIIVLAIGNDIEAVLDKFIDLVLVNNRENQLQTIGLKYIDIYREEKKIFSGKLTTAIEINATIEDHLMAMIEKQTHGTLELEKNVDPEILGGFMIEVDNLRWDATLKNELRSIKNKLIESSI